MATKKVRMTGSNTGMEGFVLTQTTAVEDYEKYMFRFECFLTSNQISITHQTETLEAAQTLMAFGGDDLLNILIANTPDWTALKAMTYQEMRQILDRKFVNANYKFNLVRLYDRKFSVGDETFPDYITALVQLAKSARNADTTPQTIVLDKLILCQSTPEKMRKKLMKEAMTIEQLLEWYQKELIIDKTAAIFEPKSSLNRLQVEYSNRNSTYTRPSSTSADTRPAHTQNSEKCNYCGRQNCSKNTCIARGQTCKFCKKLGHFERVCKQKTADKMAEKPKIVTGQQVPAKAYGQSSKAYYIANRTESAEISKIDVLYVYNVSSAQPYVRIKIGETTATFLADTGAQLNIISRQQYEYLKGVQPLTYSKAVLEAYNTKELITPLGEFETRIKLGQCSAMVTIVVIESVTHKVDNLLSYDSLLALNVDFNEIFKSNFETQKINEVQRVPEGMVTSMMDYLDNHSFPTMNEAIRAHPKYKPLFESRVGKLPHITVELAVDPNIKPVRCPMQSVPLFMQQACIDKLKTWLANGVIRQVEPGTRLTWLSSINPVEKDAKARAIGLQQTQQPLTEKDIRITVNYKNLNKALLPFNINTMVRPQELERDVCNALIFSRCDIRDAFSTVPLKSTSKQLTAFTTPLGIMMYNVLPQGLDISPEVYAEINTSTFGDIPNLRNIQDDFLIFGKPEPKLVDTAEALKSARKAHNPSLIEFLDRCVANNITLNEKCEFGVTKVTFFGQTITSEGFLPKLGAIADFRNTRTPENKMELHSFLGKASWFGKRIIGLANMRAPLQALLKQNIIFIWRQEEQLAFDSIKNSIIEGCLAHFNPKLLTKLYVDAGPKGVAAVLTQIKKECRLMVAAASHSSTQPEQNYPQVDKELFAAVWGVLHFRWYLLGHYFVLVTDNKAVSELLSKKYDTKRKAPLRLESWRSKLHGFSYDTELCTSNQNIADFMSRCHNDKSENTLNMSTIYAVRIHDQKLPIEEVLSQYVNDPDLTAIINHLTRFEPLLRTNLYFDLIEDIRIHANGLLTRFERILVPCTLIQRFIELAHEGHQGQARTKGLLRRHCYFARMTKLVNNYINGCKACRANTGHTITPPIKPTELPEAPWGLVSIDFTSKLPAKGVLPIYSLVLYDEFSRYPICRFTSGMTSAKVILVLRDIFKQFGKPKRVKSDNGPCFKSAEFAAFAVEMGFEHLKITPVHPPSNGGCERFMGNINKTIRCAEVSEVPWKSVLDKFIRNYRATPHPATGYTPNELMGLDDEIELPSVNGQVDEDMVEQARINDQKAKSTMKSYADAAQHTKEVTFNKDDLVLHQWLRTHKFQPIFDPKPYVVVRTNGSMVIATRDGKELCRDSSQFKKVTMVYKLSPVQPFFRQRKPRTVEPLNIVEPTTSAQALVQQGTLTADEWKTAMSTQTTPSIEVNGISVEQMKTIQDRAYDQYLMAMEKKRQLAAIPDETVKQDPENTEATIPDETVKQEPENTEATAKQTPEKKTIETRSSPKNAKSPQSEDKKLTASQRRLINEAKLFIDRKPHE